MGSLSLPASGVVHVDAQVCIYTVERHTAYGPLLQPLWQAVQGQTVEVAASELTLMETLIVPYRNGDSVLASDYEQFFQQPGVRLLPITQPILREAARLRATTKLRTPDAIHAATASLAGCVLFVTNDRGFKAVPGLPLVVLDDLIP